MENRFKSTTVRVGDKKQHWLLQFSNVPHGVADSNKCLLLRPLQGTVKLLAF
jgi:hypothetical protein